MHGPAERTFSHPQPPPIPCVSPATPTGTRQMTRSSLYFVVIALAVLAVGLAGYIVYQQNQQPSLEIKVDGNGIKIDGN